MSGDPYRDRLTDYAAIAFSTVVAATVWALFVWEYTRVAPVGGVSRWLLAAAMLFTLLAVVTLFGAEKVRTALELRREL